MLSESSPTYVHCSHPCPPRLSALQKTHDSSLVLKKPSLQDWHLDFGLYSSNLSSHIIHPGVISGYSLHLINSQKLLLFKTNPSKHSSHLKLLSRNVHFLHPGFF